MKRIEYSLIWREEQEILAAEAAAVPDGGLIVEIGTALGGTARIFHEATAGKGVRIFTVDPAPFSAAYRNLENTPITIVAQPSAQAAAEWGHKVGAPVDLLYIDGCHHFHSVYRDFHNWKSHMNKGGRIVFHDFDPVERGGVAHFGIRVFAESLLLAGLLADTRHDYKLLRGRIDENLTDLSLQACFAQFLSIGNSIRGKREKLFTSSIDEGLQKLSHREGMIDSVTACYCLDHAVRADFEATASAAHSINDFRKWAEALSVFELSHGRFFFPEETEKIVSPETPEELSVLIATEQTRITLLANLLRSVVRWNP